MLQFAKDALETAKYYPLWESEKQEFDIRLDALWQFAGHDGTLVLSLTDRDIVGDYSQTLKELREMVLANTENVSNRYAWTLRRVDSLINLYVCKLSQ